jgi:hypothetical protein
MLGRKKKRKKSWEYHIHPSFCLELTISADQSKQTQSSDGDEM